MSNRFSRLIDWLQYLGLLLAMVTVPLVFSIYNQNIVLLKPLIAEFVMFFLFGLWFIDSIEREQFRLTPSALNKPIVLYMLWLIATILLSSFFWFYSIEEMGRYLAMFLMFFLIQKTIRSRARLQWTFWVLFAVCFVATGWGLIQWLHQHDVIRQPIVNWGRDVIVSTFGNKNFFAGFLTLTAPVVFGYAWASRRWLIRGLLLALFAFEFYILMATGTRTGFLGFWLGMGIFGFLVVRFVWFGDRLSGKEGRRRLLYLVLTVAVMLVITYFIVPEHLIDRLLGAFDLQKGTQRVRWIMWTGSLRAASAAPIMGHGHGTFQLVFPNYRPTFYHRFRVSHNTRHSHNEFLEVLMETGLVGLSLFLLLFIVLGVISYRFLKRCDNQYYSFVVAGLLSGISASLAQNFASVNFRWMSSTFVLWLLVALTFATIRVASTDSSSDGRSTNRRLRGKYGWLPSFSWKYGLHSIVILVVALIGFNFYQLIQADLHLKELNGMINLAEANRVSWDDAIETGQQSIQYSPYSLSARYKLGFANLQAGQHGEAHRQYDILTDMAPNYAQIHNNIALIHRRFNRPYRSLLHFEWATGLEDNVQNHLNLTRRYSQQNMQDRAALHMLYVPRIVHEDQRNIIHVVSTKERNSMPRKFQNNYPEYQRKDQQRNRMNQLLTQYFGDDRPLLRDLFQFRRYLSSPAQRQTLSLIMRRRQQEQRIDPDLMLGLVRSLRHERGDQVNQARRFYQQTLSGWAQDGQSNPVYQLALAELFAQVGQNDRAEQLVTSIPEELSSQNFYNRSLQYVRTTLNSSD